MSLADLDECHRSFVDPGFAANAAHALKACFGDQAEQHEVECFGARPTRDRLIEIRNAINVGDLDGDSLEERLRVEDKFARLRTIVVGMLAGLVPIRRLPDA